MPDSRPNSTSPPPGAIDASRRGFLGRLAVTIGGAIAFVLGGAGLATFASPAFRRRTAGWVRVGEVDPDQITEKPRTMVVSFRKKDGWFSGSGQSVIFLTRGAGDQLVVFSATCSHLGCSVSWNNDQKKFLCPCHGGAYDVSGAVVGGPPPRPLSRLETRFEDGVLFVRGEGLSA